MSIHYISNYSAKYEDSLISYRLIDNGLIWRGYKMVNSFTVLSGFSRVVRTFRTIYQTANVQVRNAKGHLVKKWNLVVPSEVLDRAWDDIS